MVRNELSVIIGSVGSGKSTLLSCLARATDTLAGEVIHNENILGEMYLEKQKPRGSENY